MPKWTSGKHIWVTGTDGKRVHLCLLTSNMFLPHSDFPTSAEKTGKCRCISSQGIKNTLKKEILQRYQKNPKNLTIFTLEKY